MKVNSNRLFKISIDGIVQGVGFRPFIYNYAIRKGYKGSIRNTSAGVIIELECDDPYEFVNYMKENSPPLAKIYSIDIQEISPKECSYFEIIKSTDEGGFTHLSPDISVCSDCLSELLNPSDRRYLYPFINCTNCGPRYSIIKKMPYDRPNTTMSVFTMCNDCTREYQNPLDRRFHAQPNACHKCGPKLSLIINNTESAYGSDANVEILRASINILRRGGILAIKGIGGFHLACDAQNQMAIKKLRDRKRRPRKPLALMSLNVETISKFCYVSEAEANLLEDRGRPIVLLKKKDTINLPSEIAPDNDYLGFMLPYTPLHYLLFLYNGACNDKRQSSNFEALVMTSGNISGEPLAFKNDEALTRLSGIADAFLVHNRDIFTGIDDSVVKIHNSRQVFIRRARGYIPESIKLISTNKESQDIIAAGADIKNTFTIIKGDEAIISQHIGDLENIKTHELFQETLSTLKSIYRACPTAIAHDIHPGYHSTKWSLDYSEKSTIKAYAVQHHHAHIASVMAENNLTSRVIGVAFDGTGYGVDGNLWGGEFLICQPGGFERFAHFRYIPLPGGDMAIKECWRTAISYLLDSMDLNVLEKRDKRRFMAMLDSLGFIEKYGTAMIENILKIIYDRRFSPLSSGAGRLFDAVSALTGICDINTFEGESASALESLLSVRKAITGNSYPFRIDEGTPYILNFSMMFRELLKDILKGVSTEEISTRFHNTLIKAICTLSGIIKQETGINKIALSGGVFQNRYIIEETCDALMQNSFEVYFNKKVPCNDGGISLGQAYILNYILKGGHI